MLASTDVVKTSHLCFVLESMSTYEEPVIDFFHDSDVERSLERMFSVESLVIKKQGLSNYDEQMVAVFRQSITFKNNSYYIRLPWQSEKISCVPSNDSVTIHILDHVVRRLEREGLYWDYLEVFRQRKRDGIIEEYFYLLTSLMNIFGFCIGLA